MGMKGLWLCALLAALGCAGRQTEVSTAEAVDRHAPVRLYPFAEGTVWTYDVDTGEGVPTLAITRVLSIEGHTVEVSSGGPVLTYEIRPEGLYRLDRDGWLLKSPVRVGEKWDAGNGATAEVVQGAHDVATLAGSFRGCLTVEESAKDGSQRVLTTYCPDVGPVVVESILVSETGGPKATVKAELRGYALRGM